MSTKQQGESFGKFLQTSRRRRGLTQQQLADLATLSVRAVRDLESDRVRAPRRETVRLLARELRMSEHARKRLEALAFDHPQADQVPPPPLPLGTLLCRNTELRALTGMLAEQHARLIEVTGLSGVGKSRLVAEAARIWQESGAQAYWISGDHGCSPFLGPATARGTIEGMASVVNEQRALLVLDDFAGTKDQLAEVMTLLQLCPNLFVITTSHRPIAESPQTIFALRPLAEPADGQESDLAEVPSVRFLLAQIRKFSPGFTLTEANSADVARICQLLSGLPYALEVAGAWFLMYSSEQLLAKISWDPLLLAPPFGLGRSLGELVRTSTRGLSREERALVERAAVQEQGTCLDDLVDGGDSVSTMEPLVYRIVARGLLRAETSPLGKLHLRVPSLIRSSLFGTRRRARHLGTSA